MLLKKIIIFLGRVLGYFTLMQEYTEIVYLRKSIE